MVAPSRSSTETSQRQGDHGRLAQHEDNSVHAAEKQLDSPGPPNETSALETVGASATEEADAEKHDPVSVVRRQAWTALKSTNPTSSCIERRKNISSGPSKKNVLCMQCKRAAAVSRPEGRTAALERLSFLLRGFDSRDFVHEARSLQAKDNHDDSKVEVSQKWLTMMADALDEQRLVIAKKDRDAANQDSKYAELERLLADTRKETEQLRRNKQPQVGGFRW